MIPVMGFAGGRERGKAGLKKLNVNGFETECVKTPACVPPRAVTAHCFPFWEGGVSVVKV